MKRILLIIIIILFASSLISCSLNSKIGGALLGYDGRKILEYEEIKEFVDDNIESLNCAIEHAKKSDIYDFDNNIFMDGNIVKTIYLRESTPLIVDFHCSTKGNAQNKEKSGFIYLENNESYLFDYEKYVCEETSYDEITYSVDEPGDIIYFRRICDNWWYYYIRDF